MFLFPQNLGEKHLSTSELGTSVSVPAVQSSGTSSTFGVIQSATTTASRYHPYQRETNNIIGGKTEIRTDPRLSSKVGSTGGKDKPKDPRLLQQLAVQATTRPSLSSNQVNTNRDPRQRRL